MMGMERQRQREIFMHRMMAWRNKTGNKIAHGIHDDCHTRAARMQMAHKPYGHYNEYVDTAEPERESLEW